MGIVDIHIQRITKSFFIGGHLCPPYKPVSIAA
jgi:hypothetical protein